MSEKNPNTKPGYEPTSNPWDDLNEQAATSSSVELPNPFAPDNRADRSKSIWEDFNQAESPFAVSTPESTSRLDGLANRGRGVIDNKLTKLKDKLVDSIGNAPLVVVGSVDYAKEAFKEGRGKLAEWSKNKAKELFSRGKEGMKAAYSESIARKDARKEKRIKARAERAEAREERQAVKLEANEQNAVSTQEKDETIVSGEKPFAEQVKKPSLNKLQMQDAKAMDRAKEIVAARQKELAELKRQQEEALQAAEKATTNLAKVRQEYAEIPGTEKDSSDAKRKQAAVLMAEAEVGDKMAVVNKKQEKIADIDKLIGDVRKGAQEAADRIYERNIQAMARKAERQQARREARRDFAESTRDRIGKFIDEDAPKTLRKIGGMFKRGAAKFANGLIRAKSAVEGARAGWNADLEPTSEKNQADYNLAA